MRKISAGLVPMFLLLVAAPAAGGTINGPISYGMTSRKDPSATCRDIVAGSPGGPLHVVAATSRCEDDGRFSPSGRRIAWTSVDEDGRMHLHVAGRRGRGARVVTDDILGEWGWSHTDDRLVYMQTSEIPLNGDIDLWVTDAFGHERAVTDTPDRSEQSPTWSPDGTRIAFLADGEVYTIAPDGTDEVQLTEGAEATGGRWDAAGHPAWSPDSSNIAFVSQRDDAWLDDGGMALTSEIYVVPSIGGEMRNVTNLPATEDREPRWLDDRRLVWIAGYHSECEGDCDADVYAARWDGTRRRIVAGGRAHDESPTVSPNGRWIAFNRIARRDRYSGVFKVRSNGTRLTKLVGVRHARPDVDDWGRR